MSLQHPCMNSQNLSLFIFFFSKLAFCSLKVRGGGGGGGGGLRLRLVLPAFEKCSQKRKKNMLIECKLQKKWRRVY